jgi:sortase (surface protein transpeptidase)
VDLRYPVYPVFVVGLLFFVAGCRATPAEVLRPSAVVSATVPMAVPTITALRTDVPLAGTTPIPTAALTSSPTPESVATAAPSLTATRLPTESPVPRPTSQLSPTPRPMPAAPPVQARPAGTVNSNAPVKLVIPKIGVNTGVESVGNDRRGAMATPSGFFAVGWYDLGVVPGDPGNAVIAGHLDSAVYGAAVFWKLGDLVPGDRIQVQLPANRILTFVVERTAVYPYDNAPLREIFGPGGVPRLNLITCAGVFDRSSHNYDRRLVVYSRLLE